MIFSSTLFLFLFLPIVLGINYLLDKKLRNLFILLASLFFYAWGEYLLVFLMISSICVNFIFGLLIGYSQKHSRQVVTNIILGIGISLNLLVLIYYKYIHFLIDNLSIIGIDLHINAEGVTLPIGVSFFTFQNMSYLIDVYRKVVKSQKNLIHLGLYISLFPQLIAGPIVRYADIFKEIKDRVTTRKMLEAGIIRFIRGLAKKVIIANNVGLIADTAFDATASQLNPLVAWLAVVCYSLQIYFDFSGYSDMAIGLGKMLGFNFKENFNYPYIAKSVKDFWRRWHISLSTWFRDYLYIPLGGSRLGKYRTYVNLIIVFFITGLWHGASWNFVVWGLYHGLFLLIERLVPFTIPEKYNFLKRIYLLLVVAVGWVFFRADNLDHAANFLSKMFTFSKGTNVYPLIYLNFYSLSIILTGLLFATPLRKIIAKQIHEKIKNETWISVLKQGAYLIVFTFTVFELAQATYNPFIYYRF
ncbi:MAG: MBOAT family protein [Bacteroidales bacterium]|nr:MBOAT family protein [Bacteroidales bacterium]MCF8455498.1 MBOAT family protein [Bacteroidales bacterium]